MKSRICLSAVSALAILLVALAVQATTVTIPQLPHFPSSTWTTGSSATYHVKASDGADTGECDFRIALLGKESEQASDKDLYWVEMDFTNLVGLPVEFQQFFSEQYGEQPSAIRMNMLIPKYDLTLFVTNPSKAYKDFTEPNFIRKLYFQYNRQVPYDVDTTLIGGFILPLFASQILNNDLPQDFQSTRNLGVNMVEDTTAYTTEDSASKTSTDAGNFDGNLYTFTSKRTGPSGQLFYSGATPIIPVVTFTSTWKGNTGEATVEMELSSVQTSGAQTQITGTPVLFNLQSLMYGTPPQGSGTQ